MKYIPKFGMICASRWRIHVRVYEAHSTPALRAEAVGCMLRAARLQHLGNSGKITYLQTGPRTLFLYKSFSFSRVMFNIANRLPGRNTLNLVKCLQRRRKYVAELANRKYLPGSTAATFQKYLNPPRENFPVIVTAESVDVSETLSASECAEAVKDQFRTTLHTHGAILYRGFPLEGYNDFSSFFRGLGKFQSMEYVGGAAPRKQVSDDVYTASDEPAEISIEPHNEMAYMHIWPDVILFYCDVPAGPGCGGETVIVDVRDILKNLDESVVKKFEELGIYYNYHWADESAGKYKSWQQVFMTKDRSDVEKYLHGIGAEFKWEEDGSLAFGYKRPAFTTFPVTGEKLWFNHAHRKHASIWKYNHPLWEKFTELPYHKFPTHSYFGDMTEIPEEVIQHIREVSWKAAVGLQLQKGDVVAIDNYLVQHARLSFTGERKLLAALLQNVT